MEIPWRIDRGTGTCDALAPRVRSHGHSRATSGSSLARLGLQPLHREGSPTPEYKREDVTAIYEGLPSSLSTQLHEPAFGMEAVTFGGFHDGSRWTLRGNAEPVLDQLDILSGDASAYRAFAAEYFEAHVPLDAILHVLAGKPLDTKLVTRIASERSLDDLAPDLAEIGY